MKKPNKAILDGDIIVWKTAYVADAEGPMAIDSLLGNQVSKWTPDGMDSVEVALSCKKHDNFRKDIYPGYKENRAALYKPDCLVEVFDIIRDAYNCIELPKLEADDILGIQASAGESVAVTIDKDLRGVCGWHWNPDKEEEPIFITKEEAERWFCIQWMAGDSTDGIAGLWRVGKKKATKFLEEWDEEEWHSQILEMYSEGKHVPKNKHDVDNLYEAMGQCVRILSHENYDFETNSILHWKPKVGI